MLLRLDAYRATARTAIFGDQLALFDVEAACVDDLPFMKTVFAQGLTLVFFLCRGFLELNNVAHASPAEKHLPVMAK